MKAELDLQLQHAFKLLVPLQLPAESRLESSGAPSPTPWYLLQPQLCRAAWQWPLRCLFTVEREPSHRNQREMPASSQAPGLHQWLAAFHRRSAEQRMTPHSTSRGLKRNLSSGGGIEWVGGVASPLLRPRENAFAFVFIA